MLLLFYCIGECPPVVTSLCVLLEAVGLTVLGTDWILPRLALRVICATCVVMLPASLLAVVASVEEPPIVVCCVMYFWPKAPAEFLLCAGLVPFARPSLLEASVMLCF